MNKIEIIDQFLDQQDFDELSNIKLENIKKNEIKVYHNEIEKDGNISKSCIDENLLKKLHQKYHDKVFDILTKLNLEKSKLYDYSDFTIIKTGRDYKFPIHDDTPNKLLSGVIYLYPEINTGTIFYSNKKGDNKKVIKWKQNRAVFFSRIERETWHSYEGNKISDRIALVYNLMTRNIKEVYKLEKKNYFFGNLRWKLNPFLYQQFKIYI